ncbi:Wzz/FepE/Etk N-terminal domain-containing protein [Cupriavidus pampae]|uniref:Polysaccharide chain length determinant N-terminal domain-containing protein n=1 Tax=Cupriavidus pampae TaxID=659251 RepID=A0ABN7YAJ3_9BURK|nr:Wzz/FepE/Etk N-terminal domain-containing protein [Cupriavidus pampae]CAG9169589.1 hypothetical protein LMG32289_01746 [Cupriavidus pampae]
MTDIATTPPNKGQVSPWGLLRRSSKLILALAVAGGLLGVAASQVIKPKWVAKTTVQIGQLASSSSQGISVRLIENQLTAADRYNLPAARLEVIQAMGLPSPDSNRDAKIVFDTLRAAAGKSPDVINLQVSGYSRESALAAIEASYVTLSNAHRRLFEPSYDRMKQELAAINAKLAEADREYNTALQSLKGTVAKGGSNSGQDVLVTNLTMVINERVLSLRDRERQLQEALEVVRTYPTRLLGQHYVPEEPSTPGLLLLVVAGAALGLVIGALVAFVRRPADQEANQ